MGRLIVGHFLHLSKASGSNENKKKRVHDRISIAWNEGVGVAHCSTMLCTLQAQS